MNRSLRRVAGKAQSTCTSPLAQVAKKQVLTEARPLKHTAQRVRLTNMLHRHN